MANQPSVLLIFDLSAVLAAGKTRDWQELSQSGTCFLPQTVLEEIQFLCNRAPDPAIEPIAREFIRFYPTSGWQVTQASAAHPALQPATANGLSKKARQSLAVAQCSYGVAQESPDSLVVLVANDQPLLQSIFAVNAPNLCGVTVAALRQWGRTQQAPPAIARQLHLMQSLSSNGKTAGGNVMGTPCPTVTTTSPRSAPVMTGPASANLKPASTRPSALSQIIAGLLAIGGLAIAGLVAWWIVQPQSFNQFWRQTGLPGAPSQSPGVKPKSTKR